MELTKSKTVGITVLILLCVILLPLLPGALTALGAETGFGVQPLEVQDSSLGFDSETDQLVVDIEMYNPNRFSANVGRLTYDVYVSEDHLATGETDTGITVPGRSTETVRSELDVNQSNIMDATVNLVMDFLQQETSYVKVEGEAHYSIFFTEVSVPFEVEEPIEEFL